MNIGISVQPVNIIIKAKNFEASSVCVEELPAC